MSNTLDLDSSASPTLAAAMRQAAAELATHEPPAGLRQRLLDQAAPWPPPRPPPSRQAWWAGGAVCAAVMLGSALLMLRSPALNGPSQAGLDSGRAMGFMSLVPAERWPREAAQAWLVNTEISGARLAALGLPFDPAHASDHVRAELLVRASGEVLALRLVH